jgi:hypothetical protein
MMEVGKIPPDLEVQRRVREAHVLRSQYIGAMLRSLGRSVRSLTRWLIGGIVRGYAQSTLAAKATPDRRQIKADKR